MFCFICKIWCFPSFFIIFQDMAILEWLLISPPRSPALLVCFKICKTFLRDEFIGKTAGQRKKHWRVAKLVSCAHSPSSPHPCPHSVWLHSFPAGAMTSHATHFKQTFYTIPFSWGALWVKSFVSTKILSGGGGGRADLGVASSGPPSSARNQVCGKGFYSPAPHRALSTLLSHTPKIVPQRGDLHFQQSSSQTH